MEGMNKQMIGIIKFIGGLLLFAVGAIIAIYGIPDDYCLNYGWVEVICLISGIIIAALGTMIIIGTL